MRNSIIVIKNYFKLIKGGTKNIIQMFIGSMGAHGSELLLPIAASNIVLYVTEGNYNTAFIWAGILGLIYISYVTLWFINFRGYSHNYNYAYSVLEEKIVDKVASFDEGFKKKIIVAKILNANNSDVSEVSETMDYFCETIITLVKIITILVIFLTKNSWIGLYVIAVMLAFVLRLNHGNNRIAKELDKEKKYSDKLTDNLEQNINGLNEINQYNMQKGIKNRFYNLSNSWSNAFLSKRLEYDKNSTIVLLIPYLGKVILYVMLISLALNKKIGIDTLVLLISYFETLQTNLNNVMTKILNLGNNKVAISRINNILNYHSDDVIEFGDNDNDYINGLVEFNKVNYYIKSKQILDEVSFTALPNKITAIVGKSSAGKTSIMNLLLRKKKVSSGKVKIDDVNIYNYSKGVYGKNVVSVNNSPFIFDMSIKNNLKLVNPNVKRQIEVCKRVGIHRYIEGLPNGYNTILVNNASNIPAEKRQLLALARAILTDAEIIIFDEFTSQLDNSSIEDVKELLADLKMDHTIILITHKKELMKKADKIIVLNKGKVVGVGKHRDLLTNSYYMDIQTHNYASVLKKASYNNTEGSK